MTTASFKVAVHHRDGASGVLEQAATLEEAVDTCLGWANSGAYPWDQGWEVRVYEEERCRDRFRADSRGMWAYL